MDEVKKLYIRSQVNYVRFFWNYDGQGFSITYLQIKFIYLSNIKSHGPWWWSSGHRYSDDPSSNPTDANSFSVNFAFENNKNKQKRPGLAHLKTKHKKP